MYIDKNRYTTRPTDDRIPQEFAIYDRLEELSIPFVRVDHDHADTIEFCQEVEAVLGSKICKNLFLCNRQQTEFYLLMMPGDKPFKTKFLSAQLGCPGCPSPMTAICETSFRPFPAPYPLWSCSLTPNIRSSWSLTGICWPTNSSVATLAAPPLPSS